MNQIPEFIAAPKPGDPVNPDHYTQGSIEVIDVLRAKMTPEEFRGFCKGNVIKYLLRGEHKGAAGVDYSKASWYASWIAGVDPRPNTRTRR